MNTVIFIETVAYGIFVRTISDKKLRELERLLKFYKCFIFTWEEEKRVFKKVIFINDIRVVAVEITKK